MPTVKAIHFNPPGEAYAGKTRCGRKLAAVVWRTDPKDVTCDRCIQLEAK